MVGSESLVLRNEKTYILSNGDSFSVSLYKYYISNIVLKKSDGSFFIEPYSYHLINSDAPQSLGFVLENIPYGEYNTLEFLIGVDSAKHTSGAQSGALDPAYGMVWSWNSGYIAAKMEGKSPQSTATDNLITYHIAGFRDFENVAKKVQIELPSHAIISAQKTPVILMKSDLATWFVDFQGFAKTSTIMEEGLNALRIANNYSKMMSVISVQNP